MFKKTIFLFLAFTLIAGVAQARDIYKLYGKAPMGSKLRPVEAKSPIPFDKEYDQLTDSQKNIYRGLWSGMLEKDDVPPFPIGGTQSIYWPIIKGHERISRGGMLRLVAQIDEQGSVQEVAVYDTPHKDITELAQVVLFNAKFKPANCAGEPCAMDFPFEIKLRKRAKQMNTLNSEDIPGLKN